MDNRNFKTVMILMVVIIIMLFNIIQENKQIRNQVNILNNHGNSSQQYVTRGLCDKGTGV
jgi:inner membrane protein involved in colicin E2 resistance